RTTARVYRRARGIRLARKRRAWLRRRRRALRAGATRDPEPSDERRQAENAKFGNMFRAARADECEWLSELAFRSKAVWGYPPDFMQRCRSELTINADS